MGEKPKWELFMIGQLLSKTSVGQTTVISCLFCSLLVIFPIWYLMDNCYHLTPPPQNPPIFPEMRVYFKCRPNSTIPDLQRMVRRVLFNDLGTSLINCPSALLKEVKCGSFQRR